VSVTGEPTSQGNIDQRHQSAGNQGLGLCQAQFEQITMRRLSRRRSESSQEMSPTVAAFSGQRRKVYIRAEIRLHTFQHTP
jgi:hypothetical protein